MIHNGTAPYHWLLHQLIQFAQRLLEVSDQPVDCVAEPTGFSTAVNLRKHFGQIVYNRPHDAAVRSRTGGSVALS